MLNLFKKGTESHAMLDALNTHVYSQANIALFASLFCASLVFIGFYVGPIVTNRLYLWFVTFIVITLIRFVLVSVYHSSENKFAEYRWWRDLYIVGAALGGISWGFASILLPIATPSQLLLLFLMLAGVSAGSTSLSAAIPMGATLFLVFSLGPFIINVLQLKDFIFYIFDAAMTVYLFYLIAISMRIYKTVKESISLRFQNDELLKSYVRAKEELEKSNAMLEHAATHDPLTKMANRLLFQLNLDAAIKRAEQNKTMVGLLYIDLDRFKLVNDLYGHHVGDQLLVILIERLSMFLNGDSIARLGGDELTIILENVTDIKQITTTANQVVKLIATPFRINNIGLKISASIGISVYPKDGKNVEELLWSADKLMYYVKDHGGNNFYLSETVNKVL